MRRVIPSLILVIGLGLLTRIDNIAQNLIASWIDRHGLPSLHWMILGGGFVIGVTVLAWRISRTY